MRITCICMDIGLGAATEESYEVTDTNLEIPELNQTLLRWERVYNTMRPDEVLKYLTPQQFGERYQRNQETRCGCSLIVSTSTPSVAVQRKFDKLASICYTSNCPEWPS